MSPSDCAVIVYDPNAGSRARVQEALTSAGWRVLDAATAGDTRFLEGTLALAIVAIDPFDPGDLDLIGRLHKTCVVCATAAGATALPLTTRCRALLAGAVDVLDSALPDFPSRLTARMWQLCEREGARWCDAQAVHEAMARLGVVGVSRAILTLFRSVVRLSRLTDLPVLITGESGTGKEQVARGLHVLDPRRGSRPWVPVNCAAIGTDLLESELFGHRRGAFTGADRDRIGLVRAAHSGVLFLDEIGELALSHQAKILRLVQTQRVLGIGDDTETAVDVRVIAATNCDLPAMVRAGTFREDLYHRLGVVPLHVPPLRERRDDIVPLVNHFLHKHRALCGYELEAGDDFLSALTGAHLAGNVRELENLVCRALADRDDDAPLGLADLPRTLLAELGAAGQTRAAPPVSASSTDTDVPIASGTLADAMCRYEKLVLARAMTSAGGNQARAARMLGITARSVYNKLRKYGLQA